MEPVKPIRAAIPWLLLVVFWTFLAYFILPKFVEIFTDFGVALSPLTRAVLGLGAYWRADVPAWSAGTQLVVQVANILAGVGLVLVAGVLGGFRIVGQIGWVVLAAVMTCVMWSLFAPLTAMLNSMNGP